MPLETLRNHPLCRAEDLGKPIPPMPHAISMCLPRWRDVVGYEEKDPATMEKLHLGYPRFFHHPMIEAACGKFRRKKMKASSFIPHAMQPSVVPHTFGLRNRQPASPSVKRATHRYILSASRNA